MPLFLPRVLYRWSDSFIKGFEVATMKNSAWIFTLFVALGLTSSSSAQFTTIYTSSSAGIGTDGTPYIGTGGVLYLTSVAGGTGTTCIYSCGTVFSLIPPVLPSTQWTEVTLYNFQGAPDGAYPGSGVIPGPNGTLLGATGFGGTMNSETRCPKGCGTVFQLTPLAAPGGPWANQILVSLPAADVNTGAVVMGTNGVLYGAAQQGGNQECFDDGCGSVFELLPPASSGGSWTRMPIHHLPGGLDGQFPNSPLVSDANGVLYGTFASGGAFGFGGVFSLSPPQATETAWHYSRLYSFKSVVDGTYPTSGLTIGANGTLYGTTSNGGSGCGSAGCFGTVVSITPPAEPGDTWKKATLHVFKGGVSDGSNPEAYGGSNLVVASDGTLYGVTDSGGGTGCGGGGCGVLFQLSPPAVAGGDWTETILHSFINGTDGAGPSFAPAIGSNGVLYGVAGGGAGTACNGMGCGVVYQYVP